MVKHTTSVKKSNKSGAKGRSYYKKYPILKKYRNPYVKVYVTNGGWDKLDEEECEDNYNDRDKEDPDCPYYSGHLFYEWRGKDACGEGKWREKIHSAQAVFDACTVYGPTKGPAFAVRILNKYIIKACYKMHDPMKWAKKNEKFLRELGTIAKLQESPCCVHTPFASEIPNCCGVHYNGEHISLCNALLGAIKRNDDCHDDTDNSTCHKLYISVVVSGEKVNELKSKYDAYLQEEEDKFFGWEAEGFLISTIFNANLTADGKLQFDFNAVWERFSNEKMKEKFVKETTKTLLLWNVCGSVKRIEEGLHSVEWDKSWDDGLHFAEWDIRYEY